MRCKKCKSYNHDKANFCIKCGSKINIEEKPKSRKYFTYFWVLCILIILIFLGFLFNYKQTTAYVESRNIYDGDSKSNLKSYSLEYSAGTDIREDTVLKSLNKKRVLKTNKSNLNTRESFFARAIELISTDPLKSLILFIDGYNLNKSTDIINTPVNLRRENVEKSISKVISILHRMGEDNELLLLLTPDTLNKIESINIFKDVLFIIVEKFGYARAIQFAESVKHQPFFTIAQVSQNTDNIILLLYCKWLSQQLNLRKIDNAKSIYEFAVDEFPGNGDLELFGVEIALIQGDWEKAELLLGSINVSEKFLSRVNDLKNKISDLKGSDGKTIIRFKPGTKHIPLYAELNNRVKQKFLLDTGASFITIPSSTVKSLGLKIGDNIPVRNVATAGGIKKAKEIMLDSVRLGNCVVNNIKVLVLDIPGQSDLGLLGLNFLRLFHVEMDGEKGVLILKPK